MSEGIVDVEDVWDDVSDNSSSSMSSSWWSGVIRSAGTFSEAAVDGLRSCSIDGSCCMCADCTIDANSVAIVVD